MVGHDVVLIPGDGIGPTISSAVAHILQAADAPVTFTEHHAGLAALEDSRSHSASRRSSQGEVEREQNGISARHDVLPADTLDAIRKTGVALKGPCTTPVGRGFKSVNVQLRQELDLYAAVRPVRSLDGIPTRFENVDLVVFRENTEGLYSGVENEITYGVVTSLKVCTERASERIAHAAFAYARKRGRKKITVFHKANIMKLTDGQFIRCARAVRDAEYPEIEYEELIIDAACMRLVQDPSRFDMLLMENLYGDVVSDLCAGLVGGLGVVPGANIGTDAAVFEAVHGSAPDIAGKGIANPMALLMSAVMMLNHLAETRGDAACSTTAERIKTGYNQALADGAKTADLGGKLSTDAWADAVVARLP